MKINGEFSGKSDYTSKKYAASAIVNGGVNWMSGDCGNMVKVTGLIVLTRMSGTARRALGPALDFALAIIWTTTRNFTTVMWHEVRGVWNHCQLDCLFNNLFRLTTKKIAKFRITVALRGEPHWGSVADMILRNIKLVAAEKKRLDVNSVSIVPLKQWANWAFQILICVFRKISKYPDFFNPLTPGRCAKNFESIISDHM